jgi:hypothetical protein
MRLLGAIVILGVSAVGLLAQQRGPSAAPAATATPPTGRPPTATPTTPDPATTTGPVADERRTADQPVAPTPPAFSGDPQVAVLQRMLVGSYRSKEDADNPALVWNGAVVTVDGLDNAVYFEVARADDGANPFRSGILYALRRRGTLGLRVFEFAGTPTLKDTVAGLWLAPAAFPKLSVDQLRPQMDLVPTGGDPSTNGTWKGAAAGVPTMLAGAVEMTSELALAPGSIVVADRGFDGAQKLVWGPAVGKSVTFERAEPLGRVETRPGGLTIVTQVEPKAGTARLVDGGTVVFQYTGYLPDGSVFDTSRVEGRQAFRVTIPANIPAGINQGLMGIGQGERRRVVIPSALAYGETGSRAGRIPPNSTLYLDIECLMVEAPPEKAPEQAAPAGSGK